MAKSKTPTVGDAVLIDGKALKVVEVKDGMVTVEHPQGLFYMILIAPESEYGKAQPSFEQMIQSVQFQ